LSASLGAAGCATSGAQEGQDGRDGRGRGRTHGGQVSVGKALPRIVVHAVSGGTTIDLASMKGRVVLLDIWASWCGPCKEEMPLLDDMASRLRDKGIEIVAVSIDEDKASAESFLSARPKWTLTVAHDPEGKVPELLQPPKMPTAYLVDGKGVLRYINAGFERNDAKKLEDRLLALAAEGS
jgi:thiol-disulfide isomerase/thioredoxin